MRTTARRLAWCWRVGGRAGDKGPWLGQCLPEIFLLFTIGAMHSLPLSIRDVKATEGRLQQIYEAAKKGLKGDTLALAAGMLPTEYRQLCQLDPIAEMAALKGKADGEMLHAGMLEQASLQGDAKASLAILQHVHGWSAKQEISFTVETISITAALEVARARVTSFIIDEAPQRDNDAGLLTNQMKEASYGYADSNARPSSEITGL